ncbi:hypothetical protein AB0365_15485, partial [Brevibacterium casei]|uniref:hypothetical protein n=1 Tax=Brevibacterium casei TaxID=33889 RepID=UPI00344E1D7C
PAADWAISRPPRHSLDCSPASPMLLRRLDIADIQPGTYVAESETPFENCYWERLDSSGEIIDNNFINSGFRAEVSIKSSDYSFTAEGCGEWVKQ